MSAGRKQKKQDMEKRSYYTYGNVAYEVKPEYSPDREREQERERERERERRRRARANAERKAESRENSRIFGKSAVAIFLLFAGCIAFMWMNVLVHNAEVSLRRQKSELEDLRAANAILEAELTEQLDMDYIRQEATERLGMSEPQSYQVVHIDVPKQSYTVQYAEDDAVQEDSWLNRLGELLKKD